MSVSLSAGMRSALYSMGDIQNSINTSNQRLATGKKVNSAIDNARAYFADQNFKKEAKDVTALLDNMDNGLRIVNKTVAALDGMRKLVESAQALGRAAANLGTTDTARDTYGTQAASLLEQAQRMAYDAGFNGNTLLQTDATAPTAVNVQTNLSTVATSQTKITLSSSDVRLSAATGYAGAAVTAATVGLAAASVAGSPETVTYTAGDWVGAVNAPRAAAFVTLATTMLNNLTTRSSNAATQASAIQVRQEFSKAWARQASEAGDYLVTADINEEGANLSALQTKQQLSVQALSLASRSDQAILRLF
jgi:flagellin